MLNCSLPLISSLPSAVLEGLAGMNGGSFSAPWVLQDLCFDKELCVGEKNRKFYQIWRLWGEPASGKATRSLG